MKKKHFEKIDFFILSAILLVALSFRLYKINTPLADLHSWRQADTAAVSRNFAKDGINLMLPRYDDLSGRETGKDNPYGYRMVEFPLYNLVPAVLYSLLPTIPIEIYGRLTSLFFSLIIISVVYYLTLKETNRLIAIISSAVYATFPFFVFFSRVVLPETTATSLVFLAIFFAYIAFQREEKDKLPTLFLLISSLFFALSILVKPTAIFYTLVIAYLFLKNQKKAVLTNPLAYLYVIIVLTPFILWRIYISQFPEGIPASDWLFTSVNTSEGLKNILLRPAFFRWIFFERINNIILGGYLTVFFILGIFKKNNNYFFQFLLLSTLAYLFIFEGGNVQHEYYQILILPTLAIFVGLGAGFLYSLKKYLVFPLLTFAITGGLFVLSFYFSYFRVKDYYNYPSDITQIAKIINSLSLNSDKIVTDTTGDTTLLYLANRKGAPALYKDPKTLGQLGYAYMIIFNKDYIVQLKQENFKSIFENDKFTMFKL
ncbi:hypothetical protein A3F60_00475 [Candidatus Roizmanbacteria bacterium RIFCSPHIGHO2_12_FULL_39_8]|uniref:Glycosyltransferase RgtA/B/C/D-like domain-containing protein n=1 Tax=Candidatus Roizmanbacteria bacterium RIFCSPHIGHO2_12_FULL_39_8 TaxID=1802050 RepID=A0A1F7I440_9BACT|nr:MAG: hypothetical protein A3F60_00475 [Candidatus Roizmanbacteria bacterium RIFCSPHIGHO2_12_FULL_39_8]